jgi:hypothetical protein
MAGYHDETDPFATRGWPPRGGGRVGVSRLWVGGLATATIHLVTGLAIGTLVSGAAAAATRPASQRRRFEFGRFSS